MKLHEYQAKSLLGRFGVPMLPGVAATDADGAVAAAKEVGGDLWVVKAQIHAGGRGKGRFVEDVDATEIAKAAKGEDAAGKGGVRLARTLDDVRAAAAAMLGKTLVTKQTGIEGREVRTIYVAAACDIAKEYYLSVLLDRSNNKVLFMASSEGGVDIEEVAEHNPEAIKKVWVDSAVGLRDFQGRELAYGLGLTDAKQVRKATAFFQALYQAYMDLDCSMLEINPLVLTEQGDLIALDCKMDVDGNALYRHDDIVAMRDVHEEEATEIEASEYGLSFIKLDGTIGCMVNGAGLAMSTMDIIQYKGAKPANFLDVGGGAKQKQVEAAFRIITKDPSVQGILVNIFGGIMKCDVIANGVVAAVKEVGLKVPLVVRLSGTNADLGKKIIDESGLDVIAATNLDDAADKIVAAVKGA
ncbi:MAG: ADP-forming succinate--CoA ligase subunit beta [Alphaproteobacteria bacterium]|nr:ADP-forming succinate--CoA ligase subunit beta [Alphaproteobacteria bacterium]